MDRTVRQTLADASLEHVADVLAGAPGEEASSHASDSAMAEMTRRQTVTQQEAAEAQKAAAIAQQDAAAATQETAMHTRQSARYLLASVIVLALSSLATLALSAWGLWEHR